MSNDLTDDEDDLESNLPADAPSFLERIPLALQVLLVAELAGDVQTQQKLKDKPQLLTENAAAGTAEKLAQLTEAFSKDLEVLAQKWMRALGDVQGLEEREAIAAMNLVMVAGLSALGTRYHITQRILRKTVPKERLIGIDKQCQAAARKFIEARLGANTNKRPPQSGLQRVK